jgi:hypothetical protein
LPALLVPPLPPLSTPPVAPLEVAPVPVPSSLSLAPTEQPSDIRRGRINPVRSDDKNGTSYQEVKKKKLASEPVSRPFTLGQLGTERQPSWPPMFFQ